jgi:hypothetical protein
VNDWNEWKTQKRHASTNYETTNNWNYDGNCTLRRFLSGTYKITGCLAFVSQSVHKICDTADRNQESAN